MRPLVGGLRCERQRQCKACLSRRFAGGTSSRFQPLPMMQPTGAHTTVFWNRRDSANVALELIAWRTGGKEEHGAASVYQPLLQRYKVLEICPPCVWAVFPYMTLWNISWPVFTLLPVSLAHGHPKHMTHLFPRSNEFLPCAWSLSILNHMPLCMLISV